MVLSINAAGAARFLWDKTARLLNTQLEVINLLGKFNTAQRGPTYAFDQGVQLIPPNLGWAYVHKISLDCSPIHLPHIPSQMPFPTSLE